VTAFAWHGSSFICGGKDGGGAENTCAAFYKAVAWDVTQIRLEDGTEEGYTHPFREYIPRIWSVGSHVVMAAKHRGRNTVEVWGV